MYEPRTYVIDDHFTDESSIWVSERFERLAVEAEESILATMFGITVAEIRIRRTFRKGHPIADARRLLRARWSRS